MRIVFMGTPEIAVASLDAIVKKGYEIAGVITAPDKPAGRGRKIQYSAVKQYALKHQLPLLQPENLKAESFLAQLRNINPDVQVVVAFRMLPEQVWALPPKGTFNLHASLLPQYRGAAPINWAVINGETQTGVTTFFLDKQIDTGRIIDKKEVPILPDDTAGTLHDRLKETGAQLVIETLRRIDQEDIRTIAQNTLIHEGLELKKAPKIFKEHCQINWDRSPVEICNLIRGLNPAPGAFTELHLPDGEFFMKIFEALPVLEDHQHPHGTLFTDNKQTMKISCRGGYINILSMQAAGKKRMKTGEFLRGFRFSGVSETN